MEKFYLNPKRLYAILKDKGINHLFHSNTLLTSLTFIQQRALLSRGYVSDQGLPQTEQPSDPEDKLYNVWNDVFMDGQDLHKRYNRPNKYGPVLFVMKPELLLMPELCPILVTKVNPWYWKNYPAWEGRYFEDPEEIKEKYLTGKMMDSYCMFTLRSPEKTIKLNKFLQEIIVDKPGFKVVLRNTGEEKELGIAVHDKLRASLDENGLQQIPIRFRHADEKFTWCRCNWHYSQLKLLEKEEFAKRFKSSNK